MGILESMLATAAYATPQLVSSDLTQLRQQTFALLV